MNTPNVFVIKRPHSGTFYSVRRDTKPCVVAFDLKKDAFQMKKMITQMQQVGRAHQVLVCTEVTSDSLYNLCSVNHLDIILFKNARESILIEPHACDDDYIFAFEKCLRD